MSKSTMRNRIKLVKPDFDDEMIEEVITTIKDRILLRLLPLDLSDVPTQLESVVVSVGIAELNRAEHDNEGVKSENIGGWSISFIEDMLSTYENDIDLFRQYQMEKEGLVEEEKEFNHPSGLRWF